jgi:signal transduction histidine kinase
MALDSWLSRPRYPNQLNHSLAALATILDARGPAIVLADDRLTVMHRHDPEALLSSQIEPTDSQSLLALVPELIGYESVLEDLLAGRAEKLYLPLFSRTTDAGGTRYLQLSALSSPRLAAERDAHLGLGWLPASASAAPGLVVMLEDITPVGEMQQRLMQSRNELSLLNDALNRTNRDLAAANQELRKLADVRTTFVSMAAHELRTPLAVMHGYADLLLEEALGPLNDGQRESLLTLRRGSGRLLELVNHLLDLARLEAGRMELVLNPLDLDALVQTAAREFGPLFQARDQQLVVQVAHGLPAALADETRVFQILSNLLSNASKYTPAGGRIDLTVGLASAAGELQVAVRDTGVGVPADEQERLGSLFFRARTANQIDTRGVGLGLYITESLVQLHGGRFWFESQEGRGSVFYVTFLQADADEALDA